MPAGRWGRWAGVALATALAAVLVLCRLDNMYLWHDEAQTATLALNTARFGYPRAWDGVNLLTHTEGNDFNDDFAHTATPWLQFYICALSLKLLGRTTLAARLPFALAGVATVPVLWVLALEVFRRRRLADLTAVVLALYVPFLLYSRQARYYSLIFLFTTLATLCYLKIRRAGARPRGPRRRAWQAGLALSVALLFYSNYLAGGVWCAAAAAHFLLLGRWRLFSRLAPPVAAGVAAALPWMVYARGLPAGVSGEMGLRALVVGWKVQAYFVPFLSLAGLLIFARLVERWRGGRGRPAFSRSAWFFPLLAAANMAVVTVPDWYLINHFLVSVVVAAPFILVSAWARLARVSRALAALVLAACLGSNVLHVAPYLMARGLAWGPAAAAAAAGGEAGWVAPGQGPAAVGLVASPVTEPDLRLQPLGQYLEGLKVQSYLGRFLQEITHDYDGPSEAVVRILRQYGRPGETVLVKGIEYEPIVFYTGLRVVNRISAGGLALNWARFYAGFPHLKYEFLTRVRDDEIDWVVCQAQGRPLILDDQLYLSRHQDEFEVLQADGVDLYLSNSPDLDLHHFVTVREGPGFVLMHRRRSGEG